MLLRELLLLVFMISNASYFGPLPLIQPLLMLFQPLLLGLLQLGIMTLMELLIGFNNW